MTARLKSVVNDERENKEPNDSIAYLAERRIRNPYLSLQSLTSCIQ
jgi:hypothetical protein